MFVASCGTGITDCSVGVPFASSGIGRTGRHITTVVECDAAGFALGATCRARRTTGRRGFTATCGLDLGTTPEATLRAGALRCTTGFFLAGAATGEHSTSESTDAVRATGFCTVLGRGSCLRVWADADVAVDEKAARKIAAKEPAVRI